MTIRRTGFWTGSTASPRLPALAEAFVRVPFDDPPDDIDGTLTKHERAFGRSLYHQNYRRDPKGSIRKPEWHEMTPRGAG
jgi:hypothetical protein